jgi:chromosome segregation ATPase
MSAAGAGIAGGQSQSFAALELLANPTALQERINSLRAAEDSAKEQIALVGPANEILSMRSEIDSLKQAAEDALKQAHLDADALVSVASSDAALIRERAKEEAAKTVEDANSIAQDAEARRAQAAENVAVVERELTALRTRESELDEREAALQQKAEDVDRLQNELKGDRARLATARDAIEAAL